MSRYRKIFISMWGDQKFASLSRMKPSGQSLWVYLLTGPETCIIPGVIRAGKTSIAEALGWSVDDVTNSFNEIMASGMAAADWNSRIIYLPNGMFYNPPENPSVARSWGKEFAILPECEIRQDINVSINSLMISLDQNSIEKNRAGGYVAAWHGEAKTPQRGKKGRFGACPTGADAVDERGSDPHGAAHSPVHGVPHGAPHGVGVGVPHNPHSPAHGAPHGVVAEDAGALKSQPDQSLVFGGNPSASLVIPVTVASSNDLQGEPGQATANPPHGVEHGDPHYRSSNSNRNSNSNSSSSDNGSFVADAPNLTSLQQAGSQSAKGRDIFSLIDDVKKGEGQPPSLASKDIFPLASNTENETIDINNINQEADPVNNEQFLLLPTPCDPVFMEMPVTLGMTFYLHESKVKQYEADYPDLNVRQELRNAKNHNMVTSKVSMNGALRFLTKWLNRQVGYMANNQAARAQSAGMYGKPSQTIDVVKLEDLPVEFVRFWQAYPPGKGDRSECAIIWSSMYGEIDAATTDSLVKGVNAWAKSEDWGKDGGKWIPNPAKFLREERWRSPPSNRHFGIDDADSAMAEAKYSGMTVRQIEAAQAKEQQKNS